MSVIEYTLKYTILQALLKTCCALIEQESDKLIAEMPEHQREFAPVQLTLHHKEHPLVQLWYAINKEKRLLIEQYQR